MTELIEFEGVTLECEPIEYDYVEDPIELTVGFGEPQHYDLRIEFKNLQPGDTYIGKRNQGWKMGTVADGRLWVFTQRLGYIYGDSPIYPYNVGECLKVVRGLE